MKLRNREREKRIISRKQRDTSWKMETLKWNLGSSHKVNGVEWFSQLYEVEVAFQFLY